MTATKAWLLYTVLRLLFFAVPFAILLFLLPESRLGGINLPLIIAVVASALISMSLSMIFLSKLRERAAASLERKPKPVKANKAREDELAEDAEIDGADG